MHIFVKLVLALLMGLAVPCLSYEAYLRIWRPQPVYSVLLQLTGEQYQPDETIPFTLKPNYVARSFSQEYPGELVTHSINQWGLRGPDFPLAKQADEFRILILGDSYTFGVYVENEETYPAFLETILQEIGYKVRVLNAGYADGWAPDEHYAWLRHRGFKFKPDLVIYGFFIGNDVSDICHHCWTKLDEYNLPLKITNGSIWIDKLGRIRSHQAPHLTVGSDLIYRVPFLRESHLAVYLARLIESILKSYFPTRTSGKSGQSYGEDYFSLIFDQKSPTRTTLTNERLFRTLVSNMAAVCNTHNAAFALLMIPVNFQLNPNFTSQYFGHRLEPQRDFFMELEPWLREEHIPHLNLLRAMQATPGNYFPANGEVHFNPKGHEFAANQLAQMLINEHLLPPLSTSPQSLQPAQPGEDSDG